MLAKRIIPCLDVKDGRVVKGINFVNLRDAGDPVEVAAAYEKEGADELTFLDITASHEKRNIILDIVARTAEKVFMPLTVGGGVRDLDDIRSLLNSGADKVAINTAAVHNPEFVRSAAERFGSQCIVVAVDVKKDESGWKVYSHGGTRNTGIDALTWLKKVENLGAGEILLTSMDRDGTKSGFDLEILSMANEIVNIPIIASGGVGSMKHFYDGVTIGKADALLAASVFHFNEFSVMDVKNYLKKHNIEVRV